MTDKPLSTLVEAVPELFAAASCEDDGTVLAQSQDFDADVTCAVAVLCHQQVLELGELLDAGAIKDWSVATHGMNVYLAARSDELVVATGKADDKPAKVVEKLKKQLGLS